jgi:hypothetical protein
MCRLPLPEAVQLLVSRVDSFQSQSLFLFDLEVEVEAVNLSCSIVRK